MSSSQKDRIPEHRRKYSIHSESSFNEFRTCYQTLYVTSRKVNIELQSKETLNSRLSEKKNEMGAQEVTNHETKHGILIKR